MKRQSEPAVLSPGSAATGNRGKSAATAQFSEPSNCSWLARPSNVDKTRFSAAAALAALACTARALAVETVDLGGSAKGQPSAVWYQFQGADYVAAFVRGTDGHLFANVGNPANGDWTGWAQIGEELLKGSPSCVATTTQLIDCVAVGANNAVMHVRYNSKLHQWSDWESLGGYATSDPSAVRTSVDGGTVLNIFVRGPNDLLFWNEFKDGGWSDWQDLDITVGNQLALQRHLRLPAPIATTLPTAPARPVHRRHLASPPAITTDDIGGAIERQGVGHLATGGKGDMLRIFVNGPGQRLWIKKWKGSWIDWQQLDASTVSSARPPAP